MQHIFSRPAEHIGYAILRTDWRSGTVTMPDRDGEQEHPFAPAWPSRTRLRAALEASSNVNRIDQPGKRRRPATGS
jgi:hypothetical protein